MSNNNDYHNQKPMSTEQAMKLGEQTYEKNQKELAKSLHLDADDDGKYTFFGIEVPKVMAPVINVGVDLAVGPLSNHIADVAYHQTKAIAKNFGHHPDAAHATALTAELVARWGVILANPIQKFVGANTKYGQERYALHRELKSACEATGANLSHNHIVNAALAEVHQRYTDNLMLILPSMAALVPQAVYGLQMQRESKIARDAEHAGTQMASAIDDLVNKQMLKVNDNIAAKMKEQQNREAQYKLFKEKHGKEVHAQLKKKYVGESFGKGGKKTNLQLDYEEHPEKYLRKYFDDEIWNDIVKKIREEERDLKKKVHDHSGTPKEGGDKHINSMLYYAPIASTLGQGMTVAIQESQKKNGKKVCSFKMIEKLKEQMQGKQSVEFVQNHVIEIFQQVEEEMGGNKFAGGLLEKLREETKEISEYIASGKLDALALLKIAGEDVVIKHSGKSKTFQSQDAIKKVLDDMCCTQIIKDGETSEQDFIGRFAMDEKLVKDALKQSLSGVADGPEKDFIMAIMPAEMLESAGISRDDIRTHRKHAHENLHNQVAAAIIHIAALEEDLLKEHGMSAKEIASVKKLSDEIMKGNMEGLKKAVDSRDDIVTAVAAEALNEQIAGNSAVWTDRVKEASSLEERINQIKAEKAEKTAAPDAKHTDGVEPRHGEPGPQEHARGEEHKVERSHTSHEDKSQGHTDRHAKNKAAETDHQLGA